MLSLADYVKEALKNPGQWYLDRCPGSDCSSEQGTWVLTYLAKPGEDPNRMPVIVPQASQLSQVALAFLLEPKILDPLVAPEQIPFGRVAMLKNSAALKVMLAHGSI